MKKKNTRKRYSLVSEDIGFEGKHVYVLEKMLSFLKSTSNGEQGWGRHIGIMFPQIIFHVKYGHFITTHKC